MISSTIAPRPVPVNRQHAHCGGQDQPWQCMQQQKRSERSLWNRVLVLQRFTKGHAHASLVAAKAELLSLNNC